MKFIAIILITLQFLNICNVSVAWDDDELEVFDVVEEVNQNFYQLLGVTQDANATSIRKAFRQLSLQLHPDKNDAPDADVKFRNLVSVYDVLRDTNKRKHYDNVLVNGLPNWRSAVYYYRHVRKMGLLEMSIILFIVITIGQYIVAWAAYFEKRYTYEQVLGSKLQKLQKKNRKGKMEVPDLADILEKIPTPSVWNTLPFQLPCWTVASIVGIPSTIRAIKEMIEERKRRKQEEEAALAEENEEVEVEPVPRGPRRRRAGFTPQEHSGNNSTELKKRDNIRANHVYEKPKYTGGLWTDDDILELIKLVKKYPGGTPDRWEKIAEAMNRSVNEVTHMAKKIKDEGLKPNQTAEESLPVKLPTKIKTRAETSENEVVWSQDEQKALESALLKYPKSSSIDRWEKIANCIGGKTKEECQQRYRQLVDLVKKKNDTTQ
ncbi:dnaJ homolog subfamily C member 1-like [Microplitis demolitor]|uniref:dnaJ homolog subfamily C member 1-like n=1 Tax=Microplitis demolitor TaxID=69319 RepID=UPI0004CDBE71|nr:dnaJ homolog subfamily C member 1-like [Microplitis demolitor]XP_053593764.1 dnaJ homolog subfamily C member 1-like [Microplitis demolitor]XP_053593765.1 dnaJ homolog subfamily C member 1-like [Microplitis demolitor]